MLNTATKNIIESAKRLGLSRQQVQTLLEPDRVIEFEIKLKSGKTFKAYRSQHSNIKGPYKGGIRFHPAVSRDEVVALSMLMSLKTSLAGIPLGGAKGGVSVDPKQLSEEELKELSKEYVRHLVQDIGPHIDIPAPDVNTNAKVIGWMVDEYQALTGDTSRASFTGKSINQGGSAGREEATGLGGFVITQEILKRNKVSSPTYAVQGFGNVGMHFALSAQSLDPSWRLITAADSRSTVTADYYQIDAKELANYKLTTGGLKGFRNTTTINQSDAFAQPNTVLVLAALGGVITTKNAKGIKAQYLAELANGPVTAIAEGILNSNGVQVIPDILANAGGVVVSYYEWLQNINNQKWSIGTVNSRLGDALVKATDTVLNYQEANRLSLKQSAIDVAILSLLNKL